MKRREAKPLEDKAHKKSNPYDSMDPLTQSKFLYDMHMQTGNPISRTEAYKAACEIESENLEDKQRSAEVTTSLIFS